MIYHAPSPFATFLCSVPRIGKTPWAPLLTTPTLYTDGYTLIYPHNQNRAMLLNACGEVVHDWTMEEPRRPAIRLTCSPTETSS